MENRVKELREKMGWTQEQLGKALKVSRQTVISIEKGVYNPSLDLAMQISYIFEKSIHDIFISEIDWRIGLAKKELKNNNISEEEYKKRINEIMKNRGINYE